MWITLTKGPIFVKNKYKTTFFHMRDFLYELSYLIHCKHFIDIDVFSPIIVTVTSRNIIFFVVMKRNKTLNVSHNISHFLSPNLHIESFNEIRGIVASISD